MKKSIIVLLMFISLLFVGCSNSVTQPAQTIPVTQSYSAPPVTATASASSPVITIPATTAVPTTTPTTPALKPLEIVSINAKVTESNDVWWRQAWILIVKNNSSHSMTFDATINYLDVDGYIVDSDLAYGLSIDAGQQGTFNGYTLVNAKVAPNIKQVQAIIK